MTGTGLYMLYGNQSLFLEKYSLIIMFVSPLELAPEAISSFNRITFFNMDNTLELCITKR